MVWISSADIHTRNDIYHAVADFFYAGKLRRYFEEGIHHRAAQQVLREQARRSLSSKRRRESLFQQVAHLEMAKEQEDKVPRPVRLIAAGCKGLFGLFFWWWRLRIWRCSQPVAITPRGRRAVSIRFPFCEFVYRLLVIVFR